MSIGQIFSQYFTGVIVASNGSPVSGAVSGSVGICDDGFVIKAFPNNSGSMFICNPGAGSPNGFYLKPGEQIVLNVTNLNQVIFDYSSSNGSVCWLKMG